MIGACSTHGGKRTPRQVSIGKLERKRPLGRPKRKWEDGINIELKEMGLNVVDRIHSV
jgi:hypothetical protein